MSGGMKYVVDMSSPRNSRRINTAPRFTKESKAHICDVCDQPTERIGTCGRCLVKQRTSEREEKQATWWRER